MADRVDLGNHLVVVQLRLRAVLVFVVLLVQNERHWLIVVLLVLRAQPLTLDSRRKVHQLVLASFVPGHIGVLVK